MDEPGRLQGPPKDNSRTDKPHNYATQEPLKESSGDTTSSLGSQGGRTLPILPKEKRACAETKEMVDHRHDFIIDSHVKRRRLRS